MAKKVLWLLVSCLMVISLVMASCGTVAEEEETELTTETRIEKKTETKTETKVEKQEGFADPETPKYGGIYTRYTTADPMGWDYAHTRLMTSSMMMGQELSMGDWARGPAGSNDCDWTAGFGGRASLLTGCLAESWTLPDDETIVYKIRKGIHYWDKVPANGREHTADDVVWNIKRNFESPASYLYGSYTRVKKNPTSVKALDKWTVEVKYPAADLGLLFVVTSDYLWHICPDVVNTYGDMKDWEHIVGTGPWMLTDYVPGSVLNYDRNTNYWETDPLHPGNQLPYMDGIKMLIIADSSTAQAALRTGKLDEMGLTTWDTVSLLMQQCPDLMLASRASLGTNFPWGRVDGDLPFKDVRVRQALNMAVNQQEILDEYYGGHGELLNWPYADLAVFSNIYTPLEEQPQIVQDMFGYDPDRSKTMLAEAGYPDGFTCTIDCSTSHVDLLSIVREYLAKVNVDFQLNVHETGVFLSIRSAGTFEQMIYSNDHVGLPFRMMCMTSASVWNYAGFVHEKTEAAVSEINTWIGKDDTKVEQVLKDIGPFELEQACAIFLPIPHSFVLWWPWVQNFYGANGGGGYFTPDQYTTYIWLDTDMKKKMGY